MKAKYKATLVTLFFLALIGLLVIYMCSHNVVVLNPKGFIGIKERNLILTAAGLMMIVIIPVFILTLVFSWKYRDGNTKAKYTPEWEHSYVAESVWWGVPFVIILILAVITWKSSHELSPFKPIQSENTPIEIQAVALEWKWLFIYPDQGIATVNYIQFPVDTPINFEITADAPMNSFWIPQLGGQIYAMPAMRSKLHLIANEEGEYKGRSSNFSGEGFSGMTFVAKASSSDEFQTWTSEAKRSPNLDFNQYEELVERSSNNPVALYKLSDANLFDQILMKYEPPKEN
ncbi:MAG: Cytochrome bo(3) ubiquinol oxidase subunit 2 [Chlamydiae bacterium]|nr:Cytochrome bo(3) ubiquinol oxidase subunit 2 [Chlamydiota bacterium]